MAVRAGGPVRNTRCPERLILGARVEWAKPMDDVSAVTKTIKRLPPRHKQRLIDFIWLLTQVDAEHRRIAIERLEPLLDRECHDEAILIERLEEVAEALRKSIGRGDGTAPG